MTNDSQPCFGVSQSAASANATGDGTIFLCPCNTVSFDQNSDYDNTASNYKFTAPVSGKYQFNANVWTYNYTAFHSAIACSFFKNGTQITCFYANPYYIKTAAGYLNISFPKIIDLAVNDYVQLKVEVVGSTKVVYVDSSWSGFLIC